MSQEHGRRLLCTSLHSEAARNPTRRFAIVAKTNDVADGYDHITFEQISRATNYVANWLQSRFENGSKPIPQTTLAYLGVPDIRYNIIFYAALQCRYKLFVPSPRNTSTVNALLLATTECSKLVYATEVDSIVKQLRTGSANLDCEPFPTLTELLNVPKTEYSYHFSFGEICSEPVLILHSSGSTGLPKPIAWNHGSLAALDYRGWPTIKGRRNHDFAASLTFSKEEGRLFDVFPPFHAGGVMFKILTPIWNLTVPIFSPALRPPSGSLAAQIIRELKPDGIILPPSICDQLLQEHDGETLFRTLDFLMYGGGPLSDVAGSKISAWTTVISAYACTETPHVRQLVTLPEDCDYIEFHPDEHVELQPHGDGLFELVFQISPEYERDMVLYHNFPNLSEWRSRDLFTRHPDKPDLYKFHGRLDDIIVLSSSEKLYPLQMELAMMAVAGVTGALVVGQGYPQAALLVELASKEPISSGVHENLWTTVQAINATTPAHGRIAKSMVLIADPDRPFKRAAKGSIIRKLTGELYSKDIQNLYAHNVPSKVVPVTSFTPSAFRLGNIKQALRSILQNVSIDLQVGDDDNFYSYGMNSIKTVEVVNYTKSSLTASVPGVDFEWLSMETFYQHPTLSSLASVLLSYLKNGSIPTNVGRVQQIQSKLEQYTRDFPASLEPPSNDTQKDRFSIAITGTTGFLGPHLLNALVQLPQISRIYCLNRTHVAHQNLGTDHVSSPETEIVHFYCDFTKPELGLPAQDYSRLLKDCGLILHNAWMVDFNLPLDFFEGNLESVRQLITLSASGKYRPRIVFVSTVAASSGNAVQGDAPEVVPENAIHDMNTSIQMGYAESKHIAERILEVASLQLNIPTTVLRLGHLVPNDDGILPANDLLTAYFQTCKSLGLLASNFPITINWLKVDDAARIISEVVNHDLCGVRSSGAEFFNLVNPEEAQWNELKAVVNSWAGGNLKSVSMQDWMVALNKNASNDPESVKKLPALRMSSMFDTLGRGPTQKYEQSALRAISPSISNLSAISSTSVQSWLQHLTAEAT